MVFWVVLVERVPLCSPVFQPLAVQYSGGPLIDCSGRKFPQKDGEGTSLRSAKDLKFVRKWLILSACLSADLPQEANLKCSFGACEFCKSITSVTDLVRFLANTGHRITNYCCFGRNCWPGRGSLIWCHHARCGCSFSCGILRCWRPRYRLKFLCCRGRLLCSGRNFWCRLIRYSRLHCGRGLLCFCCRLLCSGRNFCF